RRPHTWYPELSDHAAIYGDPSRRPNSSQHLQCPTAICRSPAGDSNKLCWATSRRPSIRRLRFAVVQVQMPFCRSTPRDGDSLAALIPGCNALAVHHHLDRGVLQRMPQRYAAVYQRNHPDARQTLAECFAVAPIQGEAEEQPNKSDCTSCG